MKLRFAKYLLILCMAIVASAGSSAQESSLVSSAPVFSADSLASGNFKDILTSFYQLAFDNLAGPNKELNFNSNPFAIMLRNNPKLAIDKDYYRYRALRKLNFGFGIRLDTSFRFSGFSSTIRYALINKRDSTTSKMLFYNLGQDPLNLDVKKLQIKLLDYLNQNYPSGDTNNISFRKAFNDQLRKMVSGNPYIPFNSLDGNFRMTVDSIAKVHQLHTLSALIESDPSASIQQQLDETFKNLKSDIKNDLLWTVSVSDTTYKDQFLFSNITFATELSKGLTKPKPGSNLELNIRAYLNFTDDSLLLKRDLKRVFFSFEPGVNWVIRNKDNDQSFLEFKLGGSYTHNFSSLYAEEKRDRLMFDGTLRVRVFSDIWVPLQFKYEPRTGNVFGFLNVKANFTAMSRLLSGK